MRSFLQLLFLAGPFIVFGQISLLKDIYPGATASYVNASPSQNGAITVFNAQDEAHGIQLWRSDGTESGTFLLKEIYTSPSNFIISQIAVYKDKFWFIASGKLYQSDGTTAGTTVVKTFEDPSFYYGPLYKVFKDELYFSYGVAGQGEELWKTDGTTAGTVLVKDINPGSGHSRPTQFMVIGDLMLFSASDGTNGFELWKTDGTSAGTALVKDIRPGSTASLIAQGVGTPLGAFFTAEDGTHGKELWVSDGTTAGTHIVKDINPTGSAFFTSGSEINQGYLNGKLIFLATDGVGTSVLWSTDGTEAGTTKIIDAGASDGRMWFFDDLAFFVGTYVFVPWVTDGTTAGTFPLTQPGAGPDFNAKDFMPYKGKYVFSGHSDTSGYQIWETDGTVAGTQVFADLVGGATNEQFTNLTVVSNTLFMYADDGVKGLELYSLGGAVVKTNAPDIQTLTIQPNPAGDFIRLAELTDGQLESGQLDLFSMSGQKIKSWTVQAGDAYDVSGLPAGTYWVQLCSASARRVGKLVILR